MSVVVSLRISSVLHILVFKRKIMRRLLESNERRCVFEDLKRVAHSCL